MTHSLKSRSVFRSTLVLLCACLTLAACDDKKADGADGAAKAEIKWPEKPADGSNVALEMVELADDGATFKVYNFADADLTEVSIRQRFLDDAGKELGTFPHMAMGTPLVAKKSMAEVKTVIMEKPAGMTKVEGVVRRAKFSDGTEWRSDS